MGEKNRVSIQTAAQLRRHGGMENSTYMSTGRSNILCLAFHSLQWVMTDR